jgi:hypothetical protein
MSGIGERAGRSNRLTSLTGQGRSITPTSGHLNSVSAAPPLPGMGLTVGAISASCQQGTHALQQATLLNRLISSRQELWRHGQGRRLGGFQGGFQVDRQLVLVRRLHRKVGWLLALEDAIDVTRRTAKLLENIIPIRDQTAAIDKVTSVVNGG